MNVLYTQFKIGYRMASVARRDLPVQGENRCIVSFFLLYNQISITKAVLCLSCYENVFTSCRSALGSSCLFGGFGRFGRLFLLLLTNSNDVNMDLPLTFLLLVSLAGRGGKRERQGKGRRTHDLSLCLGQETLLRGVGVLVGKE